jgi:hypothetical protein
MKHAQSMREKAMAMAKKRKEEFIGARVPKELREQLFARAEQEGLPVSLLLRRIVEAYVRGPGLAAATAAPVSAPPIDPLISRFSHVLGWDKIALNRDVTCSACGKALRAGSDATVGFSATGGAPVILCSVCKGDT